MRLTRLFVPLITCSLVCVLVGRAPAQTPEQQQLWDAQRAQAVAQDNLRAAQAAEERESRKRDPEAWVHTLDPMSAGGWEFRAVAKDGSWATFSTRHQMKRSRQIVTVWLREEYAETQTIGSNHYLSLVEKSQYDCSKDVTRPLIVIYYSANNIQGTEQTEEADAKSATWNAIVPGTREESNSRWACSAATP